MELAAERGPAGVQVGRDVGGQRPRGDEDGHDGEREQLGGGPGAVRGRSRRRRRAAEGRLVAGRAPVSAVAGRAPLPVVVGRVPVAVVVGRYPSVVARAGGSVSGRGHGSTVASGTPSDTGPGHPVKGVPRPPHFGFRVSG
ncbi:heavy metal-transporting P-type ATPase [Streptomyces lydicamycinicus]|uniref:Heavy metal-transporting P-type ATPase n=1 Tax=Streptomyces lydicamycinicus TaxID=1546107 RepID=A0A0P4R7U5_9ACTN|nr:heavy metal-transporting P-type ATPase [Streptomyces lydicamycinicus]